VDGYAIGKEAHAAIWQAMAVNDARFTLQVSWDGYYSLWLYDRYVSGQIPQVTFHIAAASQKPMVRTELGLVHINTSDSQFSKTNKPLASQFSFSNTGFISHVLSDVKLQHAELYGAAYDKPSAVITDPEIVVNDNGFNYYYTTTCNVKINGTTYESEGAFFSYAHDYTYPVLSGSASFIDF
jgi:hypothetical protein